MMLEKTQQIYLPSSQMANPPRNGLAHNNDLNQEEEDDGDNDEENIIIDMPEEEFDEEEDQHAARGAQDRSHHQVPTVFNNNNSETIQKTQQPGHQFQVGDLVWFDPNQLGYSIPGKVIDYYPDLTLLTVRGYAQPLGDQENLENHNKQLLSADQTLQAYDLSDPNQINSLKLRLPLTDERGLCDLVELEETSNESIIWNMKLRYKQELIYTQCGHKILISVNPFKQLNNVYNLEQVNSYHRIDTSSLRTLTSPSYMSTSAQRSCNTNLIRWLLLSASQGNLSEAAMSPHIFKLADEALKRLLVSGQEQCFIMLGESGSGKTEASKLLVQYLASVNKSPSNLMTEQILEAVQMLESFGNAKTTLNHNSSRFGKLLDINFDLSTGFISKAKIIDLSLLDRSRIVSQSEGERNYHVFYELLSGLGASEKEKYGLQGAEKYFYLNQGHCVDLDSKEDSDDFCSLLASMQVLGFNYEEQDAIFRILASVIHLGNIYFHRKVLAVRSNKLAQQQQRIQPESGLTESGDVEGVAIGSDTEVRWVSHLLQIQFDAIMRCLTVRTTETSSTIAQADSSTQHVVDKVVSPLNIDQALDTRDAVARALYTCLFKWLVQRINVMIGSNLEPSSRARDEAEEPCQNKSVPVYMCQTTRESICEFQPDKISSCHSSLARKSTSAYSQSSSHQQTKQANDLSSLQSASIGILDAFGFESLQENNFEQLCINYTAELLHYHTVRYLFRLEQAEYVRERLTWTPIQMQSSLPTNVTQVEQSSAAANPASVVNLISKKPLGILPLLDDECNFPKATDQSFVEKCHHNHALNDNYQRARLDRNGREFGIRHFGAGSRLVWYQVEGFVEKNRDSLRMDIVELLMGSRMGVVGDMLRKHHQFSSQTDYSAGSFSSAHTKTISRTFDGRYVSMKPRATTNAARFQEALLNNKAMESINYAASSRSSERRPGQLPAEAGHYSSGHASGRASLSLGKPNPWFVLCVKPNRSGSSQVFDVAFVQEQVRAMNLLELVQMRKSGFPVRMRYGEFVRRYKCLVPQKFLNALDSCKDIQAANQKSRREARKQSNGDIKRAIREVCSAIIEYRFATNIRAHYQCGLTKMFLNERLYQTLEEMRLAEHQKAIKLIQKTLRMWLFRREFLIRRRAAVLIQSQVRGLIARQNFWRQYYLIVCLQRHWRRHLQLERHRQLEAKRKARRLQQQSQLHELQAQQRVQANQFRHRLQPAQISAGRAHNKVALDIPEDLAELYKQQRDWNPLHELMHVAEVDLEELASREQARLAKHAQNHLSVPFVADGANQWRKRAVESEAAKQELRELEDSDNYSLHNFISSWFPLEAPQFGYSRLPITRPFCCRLPKDEAADELRLRMFELKAVSIYKLILRYIDSDLSVSELAADDELGQREQTRKLAKFKLISDYVIHHCILERLLRNEVYLQLVSQSWQNPRAKSVDNVWRFLVNCLNCFSPTNRELARFLLKYALDYCTGTYRQLVISRLSGYIGNQLHSNRKCPPSMLEYCANQQSVERIALAASFYMDDNSLSGPIGGQDEPPELSLEEANTTNLTNRTLVEIAPQTTSEELARAVLEARGVPSRNLLGWTVEIQQEQNELMSGRLRGNDCTLDHLAQAEMLPGFVELVAMDDERTLAELVAYSSERNASEARMNQRKTGDHHRERSRHSGEFCRRDPARVSSDLDLSSSVRLSQTSELNRRYNDFRKIPINKYEQAHHFRHENSKPASYQPSSRLHRRSMSMQELIPAALSARVFTHNVGCLPTPPSQHYASSRLPTGYESGMSSRRSRTPSFASSQQQRRSSSNYGSYAVQGLYYNPEDCCQDVNCATRHSDSLSRSESRNSRARRSASSSSRLTVKGHSSQSDHYSVGLNSRYTESSAYHSDYERVGPSNKPIFYRYDHHQPAGSHRPSSGLSSGQRRAQLGERQRRNRSQSRDDTSEASNGLAPGRPSEELIQGKQMQYVVSSAMSDTSEAPSLASHVRAVKVPQNNKDLDQYLDDLFNPLLDEAGLNDDELSDTRSLATSMKFSMRPEDHLSNLLDAKKLARIIRGVEEESAPEPSSKEARLSPTFESLLKSLRDSSNADRPEIDCIPNSIEVYSDKTGSMPAELTSMNITELKALNQKLESEILAAQSNRPSLDELMGASSVIPPPPPQPSFGCPDDSYDREKTIRIGKWRWPPPREQAQEESESLPASAETELEAQGRKRLSGASGCSDAGLEEAPLSPNSNLEHQRASSVAESKLDANIGKLKISSEMKAKLEKLTTGSGANDTLVPAEEPSKKVVVAEAKRILASGGESGISRLNEQRRQLLEKQLGVQPASEEGWSAREALKLQSGKILAAKQQLAAAAGVALDALDSSPSSQASSRRQSARVASRPNSGPQNSPGELSEQRRLRVFRDELGPQSRSAISQRQAFYQMSASDERLDELEGRTLVGVATSDANLDRGNSYPPPPLASAKTVSSEDLAARKEVSATRMQQQPLVRAMQMSANLNEAGKSSELGRGSERLYGQSVAKSLSQRQHESLKNASAGSKTSKQRGEHLWVSSSPDPSLEMTGRRLPDQRKRSSAGAESRLVKRKPAGSQEAPRKQICLRYANVDWQVRIRKELFRPSETYDEPLVLQLIFAQLVADVFNPRQWTRLNQKERGAMKALMRDNSIGYSPSLPPIGQMQQVKRELVRMARSFGLYFTRSYQATNFACSPEAGELKRRARRRRGASSQHSSSGTSSEEGERAVGESQALRLLQRLRNADNLGLDKFEMVALHHSGLRLVRLVREANAPAEQSHQLAGYKVLETLKYRDMTDVSQVSQSELLVSMRNGKKCWILSSEQVSSSFPLAPARPPATGRCPLAGSREV